MATYKVFLESLRGDGNTRTAIIASSSESEAMAVAKMKYKGYRAVRASLMFRGTPSD